MKFLFTFLLLLITKFTFAQICTGSVGDAIINETFGAGTSTFGPPLGPGKTSSLNFQADNCPGDGHYAILNYTSGCWPYDVVWHTATDHTGNGYYMLINASYQPSDFYIQKVTGLCEGTTYQFAAWLLNMCSVTGTLPNITMTIEKTDGTVLAKKETGDIPIINPLTWQQYGFNFTTPAGVSEVVLRMRNNAPGGVGNDVGLDDITFRPIGPSVAISAANVARDTAVFCESNSNTLQFSSSVEECYVSTAYQWQQSTNGGTTWTDIAGATAADYTSMPVNAGVYMYRLAVAQATSIGNTSCRVTSKPFTILVYAKDQRTITIAQSPDYICGASPVTFTATTTNGGNAPAYQWQLNGKAVGINSTTFTSNTLFTGDVVNCIFTSSLPCNTPAVSNSITVKIGKPVTTTINQSICEGENYAGYSQTGTYTDVFKSSSGCDSTRTLNLTVKNKITITIDTTICYGSNYNGYTASGIYTHTFTAASGCDSVQTINLNVLPDINRKVWNDTLLCTGDTIVLSPGVFDTYVWQDGSAQSSFVVHKSGVYTVIVGNQCGTAVKQVNITEQVCTIAFPTGFTPNGDGLNDVFKVVNGYNLQYFRLRIINRWGQQVFTSGMPAKGWNGMMNGRPAGTGTYIWFCEYKRPGSTTITSIKGVVTLIR
ncbi:gliding motility-associated C-terminal domain-containing protein [Ilyomonas limi]|uniref:Gliding motility-associated C-terminal domain-containing protein n=1 Tax=Ilyomonas limi TaxID=2575867 RepID=A0A4U3L6A6_9BACT|nr:gliding motility-associated C-terminal domain-containing protein [Ilyomonas limi]TKK69904.1 gliding motility-associated C-terminal domain-containing protein [Ilyomonas limi]